MGFPLGRSLIGHPGEKIEIVEWMSDQPFEGQALHRVSVELGDQEAFSSVQTQERLLMGCQDRGKNPQNNRDKNPQDKRSRVGYFSFLAETSDEAEGRSLSLRR